MFVAADALMPVLFLPHGGGPLPLLDDPSHSSLTEFIRNAAANVPRPRAILMVSAHWEEAVASVSSSAAPDMLYDYEGFPAETYQYQYTAPGQPQLAALIVELLAQANIPAKLDPQRQFDHGIFVPLMLMYPQADIPVVQLSLLNSLDPAAHVALGAAIAPLREQGILIIGSGLSFHNMHAFFSSDSRAHERSRRFDQWLVDTLTGAGLTQPERRERLEHWQNAPEARFCHPREEHLLPLLVCFGASGVRTAKAQQIFTGQLFATQISGFCWI